MRSFTLLSSFSLAFFSVAQAFVPNPVTHHATQLYTTSFHPDNNDFNNVVASSNIVGNSGFDPLHLAQSREQLTHYRKAEIKHSRLAILAILVWTWSDLNVVDAVGATQFFEGRAFPEFLGALIGLPAALELYGEKVEEDHASYYHDNTNNTVENDNDQNDSSYFIGNLELDLFHLYPAETQGQRTMQLAEIMTGRACMLAAAMRLTQMALGSLGIMDEQSLLSLLPFFQSTVDTVTDIAV